ncbi:intermembrane transport protein PqiB [Mariprofundus erugo]|uniref:PqiB family protein n=1 Tax=Mariprofundus erugo TaxID=2528639 RepID=UPI001EE7F329|nr:MlaD family protein [Mariprofundus erugo]
MTSEDQLPPAGQFATPTIKKSAGFSLIWLIPLLTAIIGGWLMIKTQMEQGPFITISFKTAEGIEAGKTRVKFRDIDIGVVQQVEFSDRFTHILVTAKLRKDTEQLLHQGSRFWVVKPRLGIGGISGLNTLVSGAYIELAPGEGKYSRTFTGLDTPPIIRPGQAGIEVVLKSERLGSLDTGSPIYYQGIQAGEVLGYELAKDNKGVLIHAFIREPFHHFVHSNSRFWNTSGIDISTGVDGVNVHLESVKSLLMGGIAFTTPDAPDTHPKEISNLVFTLFRNKAEITENSLFAKKERIIALFDGSVRGLQAGAPVEFNGIKVGIVEDLRLEFNSDNASFRIPVILAIEPERFLTPGQDANLDHRALFKQLVEKGLRARLRTGSLLTGKIFVELNIFPGTPERLHADSHYPYPEIPTIPGGLDQIASSVQNILSKLERVDIEKIGSALQQTLEGSSKLVNGPELKSSLLALQHTLQTVDRHAEPMAEHMDGILVQAKTTLRLINLQLKSGSPVTQMSEELSDTARAIRALVEILERNPNALLVGKPVSGD